MKSILTRWSIERDRCVSMATRKQFELELVVLVRKSEKRNFESRMPTTKFKLCTFCARELKEGELEKHQLVCALQETACENTCGVVVPRYLLPEHMTEHCKKKKAECKIPSLSLLCEGMSLNEEGCESEIVDCSYNCGFKTMRDNLAAHLDECLEVRVSCFYCGKKTSRNDVEQHAQQCDFHLQCCSKCGARIQKKYMLLHQNESCEKRVVKCQFCNSDIEAGTLTEHVEECELSMLLCSNNCGIEIPKKELEHHLEIECLKRVVMCDYCKIETEAQLLNYHQQLECPKILISCPENCGVMVSRENIEKHIDESCVEKYSHCPYKKMLCTYEGFPADLRAHVEGASKTHMTLMKDYIENLENLIECQEKRLTTMENTGFNGHFIWKVESISQKINDAKNGICTCIYSDPFYSGLYGYKMQVILHPSKFEHMSFSIRNMPSKYDSILVWPCKKNITFKVINTADRKFDFVLTWNQSMSNPSNEGTRPSSRNSHYITYKVLYSRNFLVCDSIFVEVTVTDGDEKTV